MEATETRQVGKHLFIFEKGKSNASKNGRTLIASCRPPNEEKLPQEFIKYMRKLFDILDEEKRGVVKLVDIEERWGSRNGRLGSQSSAVLENLRQVTPPDGLLSFERLCLGFQLALKPTERNIDALKQINTTEQMKAKASDDTQALTERLRVHCNQGDEKSSEEGTYRVRPRRPRSMVQLRQLKEPLDLSLAKRKGGILEGIGKTDKKTVVEKLRQWQKEEIQKDKKRASTKDATVMAVPCSNTETSSRRQVVTVVAQERRGNEPDTGRRLVQQNSTNRDQCSRLPRVRVYYQGEKVNKNGLNGGSRDSVLQKDTLVYTAKDTKLRDLEEELKVLGEGLRTVEDVRDWFFTRITALQEEKLYVKSVNTYSVQNFEAMIHAKRRQELGLCSSNWEALSSRVEELKCHVDHMMKKPFSLASPENADANQRKINQLERDKRALIRELFQYKSQHDKLND